MLKDFRQFAMRGNVIDLAVGVVVGVAFGKIVDSLVRDVIMPPIGLALGRVDFSNLFLLLREGSQPGPYASVEAAAKAGAVTLNYGTFVNSMVSFLIVAWAVFLLVRLMNRLRREEPAGAPAAPPEPSEEVRLLREIRDELKAR